jgi:hypothetical protein
VSAGTIQLVIALAGTAILVVVLAAGIVYCVRSARRNARASRDASVRAGDYPIPYVIQLRPLAAGLAIPLVIGAVLAGLTAPLDPVIGKVAAVSALIGTSFLWILSRYRVILGIDDLRYRQVLRERVIRYDDIAKAEPVWTSAGGRGVVVMLRLHLAHTTRSVDVNLTYMPERERAVIVDQLQRRATNAVFAGELHGLWTSAF